VALVEHLRAAELRFARYQDPEFKKQLRARVKETKAARLDLATQEKDQRVAAGVEVEKQVQQREKNQKKKMYDGAAVADKCAASTPEVPMAATGFIDVQAKTKTSPGADLTKEYLALELQRAGRPLTEKERSKTGGIKMKKDELIELLVRIKGGSVFPRMADPEGGLGSADWKGGACGHRRSQCFFRGNVRNIEQPDRSQRRSIPSDEVGCCCGKERGQEKKQGKANRCQHRKA
jgi:hypothetical protein